MPKQSRQTPPSRVQVTRAEQVSPAAPETRSARPVEEDTPSSSRRVDLQADEVKLLLKVCRKHRSRMPIYLKSVKEELSRINRIIDKLSSD